MLFLLSPAKKLDYDSPLPSHHHTQPLFLAQAAQLIAVLKKKTVTEISALMHLSPTLAALNVARYARWSPHATQTHSRPAVLAFNGDVYAGLQAATLSSQQLDWAQQHLVILSGLYGALRPLDLMQPYRLEMGTRLVTPQGKNLYEFWGETIAEYLNQRQAAPKQAIVVNLASDEYFKVIDRKVLKARVVQCVFQDWKSGSWKIINFYAKRARGLMARYAIERQVSTPEGLHAFASEGYTFDARVSADDKLVFRRKRI
jgi:hypothetical protein